MYYLWISPLCILFFIGVSWFYVQQNESPTRTMFLVYSIFRAIPLLPLIAHISKRPVFDAMLYDVGMFVVCAVALGVMSKDGFTAMSRVQLLGFAIACSGFVLMAINPK